MIARARVPFLRKLLHPVILILLLALIVLPGSASRGQDVTATPPEQEQPTLVPLPTDTATLLPTDTLAPPTATETVTLLPTDTLLPPTVTETPTETATLLPTDTLSPPSATETATETSSPTPSPAEPSTAIPTETETPPETAIASETPLPVIAETATLPPTATTPPVGPVTLLNDTAEIETDTWSFEGTWNRSNLEAAHAGEWVFSDSPGVPYPAGAVSSMSLVQPLSLPPDTQVQLQYWQQLDLGTKDSAQVQVSTDNVTWTTVASETAVRNLAWTVHTVRLDAYAGQSLGLRFVLSADNNPQQVGEGWWLDDITVTAAPLPVTPLFGLSAVQSDDPAVWLTEGTWQATAAPVFSGSTAWTGVPQLETAAALTLNADVSLAAFSQPELSFAQVLDLAAGGDSAQVQISTDGGQTWTTLATYTADHNTDGWAPQALSLAVYLGQTGRVRFLLVTDGDGAQGTGWTVDAIALQDAAALPPTEPATPTPTIEEIPSPTTEPAVGWTTYPDTDPLLVYRGAWQTYSVSGAAGGTLTGTAEAGATLTVYFEGTGIQVLYSKGPEGGPFTAQVDGDPAQMADGYADDYRYGYAVTFENLLPGQHELTVTNGTGALWVEAVAVQGSLIAAPAPTPTPTPVPSLTPTPDTTWTTVQDTDPRLVYSGAWETFGVTGATGGTLTTTTDPTATLTVYFEGTGIRLVYAQGPGGGTFDVRVDGGATLTLDSAADQYGYGYQTGGEGLPEGFHTLTVTNGPAAVWIEGVAVQGGLIDPLLVTPTTTPTPSQTPTAASFPPEPELRPVIVDDFKTDLRNHWRMGVGWALTNMEGEPGFQVADGASPAVFRWGDLLNVAVYVRFRVREGVVRLSVRQSAAGSYSAALDTGGVLHLYRGSQELVSTPVSADPTGQWHILRLSAIGGVVRVAFDGVEVLAVADAQPLPPGAITLAGEGRSTLRIGEYSVWRPLSELQAEEFVPAPGELFTQTSDGEVIVFTGYRGGDAEVYRLDLATCAPGSDCPVIQLTFNGVWDGGPRLSPDGSQIAFSSNRDGGNGEIYVMNADGSNPVRLTYNSTPDGGPVWSPDGGRIAFTSSRDGDENNIYVLSLADCVPGIDCPATQLTTIDTFGESASDWHGNQIAYSIWGSPIPPGNSLWVMNDDGSNQQHLTYETTIGPGSSGPRWSPDGNWIAFVHWWLPTYTDQDVAKCSPSNCEQTLTELTTDARLDYSGPVWSPDGSQIVFYSGRSGVEGLYVMNADGTNPVRITHGIDDGPTDWGGPASDLLFRDGFESSNLSSWSSSVTDGGDLSVTTAAALTGTYGLQAVIDDRNSIYATRALWNPQAQLRARFYFDPNSITMGNRDAHVIFQGSTDTFRVEFQPTGNDYQLRATLNNDASNGWTYTNWFTIDDAPHLIELYWAASTSPGANDGSLTLWLDDVQQQSLTGIDNDTRRVTQVDLGAVSEVDRKTSGVYYFDAVELRQSSYIGPVICQTGMALQSGVLVTQQEVCVPPPDDDCSDGTIDLISQNTYQSYSQDSLRELQDMRIVFPNGITSLTAPMINAKPFDPNRHVFLWGQSLVVYSRIEFPQTANGVPDKQVWYEVSLPGGDPNRRWIPIRYDGNNYALVNDPCNGLVGTPINLTFQYDRPAAAEYAIEHSYHNGPAPNLPAGHVTEKFSSTLSYADFFYSYLSSSPGSTGSAMFVSEAIWAGGLPMTVGDPASCFIDPDPYTSEGWRYCRNPAVFGSNASNPWDFHQELLEYYTDTNVPGFNYQTNTNNMNAYNSTVLSGSNLGYQLNFSGCGTVQADRISSGNPRCCDAQGNPLAPPASEMDLSPFFLDGADRGGIISDSAGLSTFIQNVLSCYNPTLGDNQTLVQGDYIYINPQDMARLEIGQEEAIADAHGLLVVGWGPIVNCPDAFTIQRTISEFSTIRDDEHPVPYVSDFTTAQPPRARPFYCTMTLDGDDTWFTRHDWFFFHMPDTITLTPSEIYINSDWNW